MPATFHPADPANPFADFDVSKLYAYLASRGVGRPPDPRFRYSNLGFGLLGHALSHSRRRRLRNARSSRPSPDRWEWTTRLSSSRRNSDAGSCRATTTDRQPVPEWDIDVLAGAGALRSTAPDMLTWLEANLHPERVRSGTLSAALVSSQQVRGNLGSDVGIALDWIVNTESGDFQHGGAMAGFTADAFFNPRRDVSGHRVIERGARDLGVRGCSRRAHSRPSERRACSVDR